VRDDGRFLIPGVPAGAQEVAVVRIGFAGQTQSVTVPAGGSVTLNLRLREEAISLDEIVVTGVGAEARRREIGNSMAQVSMEDMDAKPLTNVESALRATVAGVQSLSVSGQVGSGGTLILRGVTSVSQGNEPLIYVDGVRLSTARVPPANLEDGRGPRVSGMSINDINPQDIERIEILKGAAATTLYGTEASAGVIQIFTKRGQEGAPQWSFGVSGGGNFWPVVGKGITDHPEDLSLDQAKRTGAVMRYNGSVRGGSEQISYFVSGEYSDEEGIVPTQESQNWGGTGNFTIRLNDELTLSLNNSYSHRNTRYVPDSNNRHGYVLNVLRYGKGYDPGNLNQDWVLETELRGVTDNFVTGARMDLVTGNIRNKVQVGLHQVEAENSGLLPFGYLLYEQGSLGVQRWRNRTLTVDYNGSWQRDVNSSVASTLTWGGQIYDESRLNINAGGLNFAGPGNPTISSAALTSSSETRIREVNAGFFLQETVGFSNRLFLIGGLRVDGSSTFGDDYGFQYYPKLSASWVASEESFWNVGWVDQLRLRAAVGVAGRAPGVFDAVRTWEPIAGMEGQPGVTPQNLGNPDLGPERTREYELGFDASVLDQRLSAEFTYYHATTSDALFPVLGTPTLGFTGSQVQNVGEIVSSGFELSADVRVYEGTAFAWNAGVNLTTNNSEVIDMGGAAPISLGYNTGIREGFATPSIFGRKLLNPEAIADPEFEDDAFLGEVFPTTTLGVHTDFRVGEAFSLGLLGEFSSGGHVVNETARLNATREFWPYCDDAHAGKASGNLSGVTARERARCLTPWRARDQWVESGDFFKLRDVTLTYQLPQAIIPGRVSSATLSITGRDLFKSTDFTGLDPEVIEGGSTGLQNFRRIEYYTLPPQRSIIAKLFFTF
jgi:TonB-dependent SusC/RagA subfamily outer membrane receptor